MKQMLNLHRGLTEPIELQTVEQKGATPVIGSSYSLF